MRDDVETLLNSELIPDDITISGAIYDVQTGELREVVRDQRSMRPEWQGGSSARLFSLPAIARPKRYASLAMGNKCYASNLT